MEDRRNMKKSKGLKGMKEERGEDRRFHLQQKANQKEYEGIKCLKRKGRQRKRR